MSRATSRGQIAILRNLLHACTSITPFLSPPRPTVGSQLLSAPPLPVLLAQCDRTVGCTDTYCPPSALHVKTPRSYRTRIRCKERWRNSVCLQSRDSGQEV
eukprot:755354-Hanusia_phi.AAC.4